MRNKVLGVDVGGVIIDRQNDRADTSFFGPNYLQTSAVEGVFDCLRAAGEAGFQVHLVSKCGQNTQRKTLEWLAYQHFYERTGVDPARVHFCRTRPQKAPICTAQGITHFVDDRLDVLEYLEDVGELFLFQPNDQDEARWYSSRHRSRLVKSWPEVLEEIAGAPCR
ncbi:MAG: hypothetical protein KF760_34325 [Candidatus Eremiobacteraeota bacterium]|nr:hypothetical protein [Candidatus Eremiobacteraeota bacterium]MCW5871341.1 hypothetical protein [Candidatus Eremiobacteraeota bacterium]